MDDLKKYDSMCEQINDFEHDLIDSLVGQDPIPTNEFEEIEAASYKFLKEFLSGEEYRRAELFPTGEWIKALYIYLPKKFHYLADEINLLDSPLKDVEDHDKVIEEFFHNTKEIHDFSIRFINEKNKYLDEISPIDIANVLKHIAMGLVAETSRVRFYKNMRKEKIKINM